MVWWTNCSTLEKVFVGSNPGHGEVVFSVGISLPLPSPSLFSPPWFYSAGGVSHVVPLLGATLLWYQLPTIEKKL